MPVLVLIEDDPAIRVALERALTRRGHAVYAAPTAMAGLELVVEHSPDAVVLDLGLPDVDGTQVLGMIRGISAVPVIVATARDDEAVMVQVLDKGADDYVVKPFSAEQLEARLRAVLRRGRLAGEPDPALAVGALSVDRSTRIAVLDGSPLDLTRMEFDLLAYLAERAGRVVTKRQLMADVWQQPYGGADKTVDVHLSWLRRKLGETAADPRYLHTVRGVGSSWSRRERPGQRAGAAVSRRIVWLTLAVTSLVVIAFLVPLLSLVRDVAASRETIGATVEAQSAAALVNVDDASLALILQQLNAGSSRRTSVFTAAGVRGAAAERDAAVESVFAAPTAVTVVVPGGRAVLVPVLGADQRTSAVVRTFIPADALRGGVGTAWLALVLLGLALLAAAGGLAWLLGRSLVRPLLSVAGTADALRAGDLTARAEPAEPAEVRRIAEALNGLADRIADLLQAEREAAADLSHRLRTPLTALRLDAEGLRDQEEAERVLGAVDSLERMVSHVIASARRAPTVGAVADAAAVVRERVEFWSVLAEEQDRPVRVELPAGPVPVPVAADELAAAVDALLGNVFAHTPVGTGFAVAVRSGPVPAVVVEDAGPDRTAPALLGRGRSGGSSTGLGLDIVRRTAEEAGGRLELAAATPSGLRAVVWLGRAPA